MSENYKKCKHADIHSKYRRLPTISNVSLLTFDYFVYDIHSR